MMSFYSWLAVVNVLCFLPLYLLNIREQPNPLAYFVEDQQSKKYKFLKGLYHRQTSTDPFRVNFDWTFFILACAFVGLQTTGAAWIAALLLVFSFIEILYTSVMLTVFKRPPTIRSDLLLAATGLTIAQRLRYPIIVGLIVLVVVLVALAFFASDALLKRAPTGHWTTAVAALLLLPPCLYRWRKYLYANYLSRTVYSALLHFYLNLRLNRRFTWLLDQSCASFEQHNYYSGLKFRQRPNSVTICIESYGSVVYTNPEIHAEVAPLVIEFSDSLQDMGLSVASSFSEAPLFAGGSWLSYASLMYGTKISDVQLYNTLFDDRSPFLAYESLFHILKYNGYRSELLCPMGGIDPREVDWEGLRRCFQADSLFDYDSLNFSGRPVAFMGQNHLACAPDEYALNYAWEQSCQKDAAPFSLFFCTLSSHYPYYSPVSAAEDWRRLNDPNTRYPMTQEVHKSLSSRYAAAIRYQLEFVLRFLERHRNDDLLVTIFGDHQPPRVARQSDGNNTPVHVIYSDERLPAEFCRHGFVPQFDLSGVNPPPFRHEAFLSVLLSGMNRSFGQDPTREIPFRPNGAGALGD